MQAWVAGPGASLGFFMGWAWPCVCAMLLFGWLGARLVRAEETLIYVSLVGCLYIAYLANWR